MYNFEVEGWHTYYVGDSAVLVHNDCGDVDELIRKNADDVLDDAVPIKLNKPVKAKTNRGIEVEFENPIASGPKQFEKLRFLEEKRIKVISTPEELRRLFQP